MKKKIIIIALASLLSVLCVGVIAAVIILNQGNKNVNKANVAWYSEDEEVFTIKTEEELYDLVALSDFYDFKGQKIELGADIVVNEGNAADWAEKAPEKMWFPIQGFAGTFDGKGHTISGLYGLGIDMPMGLFSDTNSKCVIRDFKLVNSYFCVDGPQGVGSIASNGSGSFESIYTDAYVTGNRNYIGGFIGRIDSGRESSVMARQTKITNCWFSGEVRLTSTYSKMAGGFVGSLTNGAVKMEHCLSSGSVICSETSDKNDYRAGGFFGAVGDDSKQNVTATLNMNDCLHVGSIETPEPDSARVGNLIGFLLQGASGNIENSYAEKTDFTACGALAGELTDYSFEWGRTFLIDKEAYRWTDLDFDKYWSIVEKETPELTYFSQDSQKTKGLEKAYNVDWYNAEDDEYVLNTVADLYGFSKLCNAGNTFAGKTVKLGKDIVVNEGKATDWMQGKDIPSLEWIPIGGGGTSFTYAPFSGTFDGQGHTVSGLYVKSQGDYLGFFGLLDKEGNAVLKNFKITNSYFECTRTSKNYLETNGLGSIVGQGAGTLDTIYSNTILKNGRANTGGLVGSVRHAGVTLAVSNCWYDGNVAGTQFLGGIVGFMHSDAEKVTMKDCLVTAGITSTLTTGFSYLGGLGGRATSGNYDGCVVTGTLTGIGGLDGGLIGLAVGDPAILRNCYNATNLNVLYKGIEPGDISHVKNVSIDELTGIRAYTETLLEFYVKKTSEDGNWVIVKDDLVGLRSFTENHSLTSSSAFSGLKRPIVVDTTWYAEAKKEFIITTPGQLYGLAKLCNKGVSFAGKTVKLGKDIVVNDGNAADWAKGKNVPNNDWTPIGSGDKAAVPVFRPFSGTFDGQGHTISGLYAKSDSFYIGLFGVLGEEGTAVLKNFKLTNSYFEYTSTVNQAKEYNGVGSIVGQGAGTLDTIYSDAILKNNAKNTGGLVGSVRHKGAILTVKNCWYDGTATGTQFMGGILGFMHTEAKKTVMKDCFMTGDILSTVTTGYSYVGGLAGRAMSGNYEGCVVTGTLTGVGGLNGGFIALAVGDPATLKNCYNATNLTALYKGVEPSDVTHVKNVNKEELTGIRAYTRTLLGFYVKGINENGNWVVMKDELVGLRSFTENKKLMDSSAYADLERPIDVDTSWYDETKNEFVITTAGQLYGFAKLCNNGVTFAGKTVKLGKDIIVNKGKATDWAKGNNIPNNDWIPIGSGDKAAIPVFKPFSGTFDGQGHTISGLYTKSDSYYIGLFGVLDEKGTAVLKNFKLTNSYFEYTSATNHVKEYNGVGSIVGQGAGTLDTIYSNAILKNRAKNTGGLVGSVRYARATLTVTNCWYDGDVTGTAFIGGIIGFMHSDTNKIVLKDCLVTSDLRTTLTGANDISYIGGLAGRGKSGEYESCVAIGTLTVKGSMNKGLIAMDAGTSMTIKNCYNATNVQTLYHGNAISAVDVKNLSIDKLTGIQAYTNTLLAFYVKSTNDNGNWVVVKDELVGLRSFAEGKTITDSDSFAGLIRPIVADTSWYAETENEFVLNTAEQLYGLAQLCNSGVTFKGKTIKLGKNIVVNNGSAAEWAKGKNLPVNDWIPIGTGDTKEIPNFNPFLGTFDGQGYTISGLYTKSNSFYIGLFGALGKEGTAVLKNFKLTNSYFEYTGTANQAKEYNGVGSIVGQGAGTLDTIYSNAILKNGAKNTGGLVGSVRYAGATLTVTNCWYDGDVTGTAFIGGIIGFMHSDTNKIVMKDCLVTSDLRTTLTGANDISYIGGLAGRGKSGEYESCVAIGTLTVKGSMNKGLIAMDAGTSMTIKNCYNATNLQALYHGNATAAVDVKYISADNLKGTKAYTNTNLMFYIKGINKNGKWVAVKENGVIGLKSFTLEDMIEDVSGINRPVTADTTWYSATQQEYVLTTANQLYGFAQLCNSGVNFTGKTVRLGADIDLNTGWKPNVNAKGILTNNTGLNQWSPIGINGAPATQFNGTFDGQGHSIHGIYVNATTRDAGFFGYTGVAAQIKNIQMYDSYINAPGQSFAGAVAGLFCGTLIENVYVDESVTVFGATAVAGICGAVFPGATRTISKCWFDGNAYSSNLILGGIVGYVVGGTNTIRDCLVTGTITSTKADGSNASAGGFIGENITAGTKVIDCLNIGTICVTSKYQVNSVCALSTKTDITYTNVYTTNEISYAANPSYKFNVTVGTLVSRDTIEANAKTALPQLYNKENTVWNVGTDGMPILNILK